MRNYSADFYCYEISSDSQTIEILNGLLADAPFEAFEVEETILRAYISAESNTVEVEGILAALKINWKFKYERKHIKGQNWNALWESNFEPILVGDFCAIRADFHESFKDKVAHEILIQPKMAFGTGHHATTYMMMERMGEMDFSDKKVLDFGCGTGILAILASMLGANPIDAIDIELQSYENTMENASINKIQNISTYQGQLADLAPATYDIILANINRHVILAELSALYSRLNSGGIILFSGILTSDKQLVITSAKKSGFKLINQKEKTQWLCLSFEA